MVLARRFFHFESGSFIEYEVDLPAAGFFEIMQAAQLGQLVGDGVFEDMPAGQAFLYRIQDAGVAEIQFRLVGQFFIDTLGQGRDQPHEVGVFQQRQVVFYLVPVNPHDARQFTVVDFASGPSRQQEDEFVQGIGHLKVGEEFDVEFDVGIDDIGEIIFPVLGATGQNDFGKTAVPDVFFVQAAVEIVKSAQEGFVSFLFDLRLPGIAENKELPEVEGPELENLFPSGQAFGEVVFEVERAGARHQEFHFIGII